MKTAIQKLRSLWAAGDHRKAIKLAASGPQLGDHRGWAAISNPDVYRQLGEDPQTLYDLGLQALRERYGL